MSLFFSLASNPAMINRLGGGGKSCFVGCEMGLLQLYEDFFTLSHLPCSNPDTPSWHLQELRFFLRRQNHIPTNKTSNTPPQIGA